MQPKVIQTSTTKNKKLANTSGKNNNLINTLLNNNTELSKHKSYEIYNQYSPTNINNNLKSNNSKRHPDLGNNIKQNIQFSGVKNSERNNENKLKEIKKTAKLKDEIDFLNKKNLSNDEKTEAFGKNGEKKINNMKNNGGYIADNNKKKQKQKHKNDLGNILSESDSFQEIDSMEEDSITKNAGVKILSEQNTNNKNDTKNIENNYKRHLTTGYKKSNDKLTEVVLQKKTSNNSNNNTKCNSNKNNSIHNKKYIDINFNDNNNDTEDDVIVNDNEFDNSRSIHHDKLHETKFPKLSVNPFIGEVLPEGNNNNTYSINSSIKKTDNENSNNNNCNNTNNNNNLKPNNKKQASKNISNHHIKSSTLGTFNKSSTNPNSSNLSNTIDGINANTINTLSKKEINNNNNISNSNNTNKTNDYEIKYKMLLLLAKRGDKEKFLEILGQILSLPKELCNINYQDEMGYSALHYSCDEGNQKIVEILVKANCDLNIRNNEMRTPLHLTSRRGYFDISKLLIENGASLNVFDLEKNSPLHYVCMFNYVELLKYFLTKLPHADAKNIYNKTPSELTTNKEIKTILDQYLKSKENAYHKIQIYHTSDSKMKNMLEQYNIEENSNENQIDENLQKNNNSNIVKTSDNKKSSSPGYNKNPINKLHSYKNKKKNYNSINEQINANLNINKNYFSSGNNYNNQSSRDEDNIIDKKNITINSSSLRKNSNNNNNNLLNNSSQNYSINKYNNNINNSTMLKKNDLKNCIKNKDNSLIRQKNKKENKNQKNKKVLIQDIANSYNSLYNPNNISLNGLKKTRTLDQFASVNQTYNYNNHNNISHYNISNNDSKINQTINLNSSKANKSFNNNNKKSISKNKQNINNTNKNLSENKSKLLGNNLKNKNLYIDSIDLSNNNLLNLNKTEENINIVPKISRFSRTSLKKSKNFNSGNKINTTSNNSNTNNSIISDKEKVPSTNRTKTKKSNNNVSKMSIDQSINNGLDSFNKSNIIDKTLVDNVHSQLTLNSIEEERVTPSSFVCLALLGKGSFGEVYLVQKINTQEKFAMKVLRKERVMGQNLLKYAMAERNVLSLSNHPFIVKLNFAFQTSSKLFLIMEYCSGGDLAKHLFFEKRFDEPRAKFYICEVLLALENLHKRDIIFRDLKPDNVVLDEEGHCKLTDFGLSKEGVYDSQSAKSFCGSIAYLAPEMLKKQGHGKAVDWYLLGVLLYEMLVGITPYFTGKKEEIFHNIEYGELRIPNFISEDCASLLRGLLQRDPKKRLGGSSKDAQEIKEHPYFKDVDWNKVFNKELTPPQINNYSNKIMHVYRRPRLFANDDYLNITSDKYNPNMLPGWSFINTDAL